MYCDGTPSTKYVFAFLCIYGGSEDFLINEAIDRYLKLINQGCKLYAVNNINDFKKVWDSMGYNQNGKGEYLIDNVMSIQYITEALQVLL